MISDEMCILIVLGFCFPPLLVVLFVLFLLGVISEGFGKSNHPSFTAEQIQDHNELLSINAEIYEYNTYQKQKYAKKTAVIEYGIEIEYFDSSTCDLKENQYTLREARKVRENILPYLKKYRKEN